jgi:hypothetical protein
LKLVLIITYTTVITFNIKRKNIVWQWRKGNYSHDCIINIEIRDMLIVNDHWVYGGCVINSLDICAMAWVTTKWWKIYFFQFSHHSSLPRSCSGVLRSQPGSFLHLSLCYLL